MSRVRVRHPGLPNAMQGWLLVDDFGVPRFWATVWQIMKGPALADTTLGARLSSVERLYVHADAVDVDLDRTLADVDLGALETVLGGFFLVLTNHSASTGEDVSQSWSGAMDFVRFMVRHLAPSGPGVLADIERKLMEQDVLLSSLVPSRTKAKPVRVRALPATVVAELLDVAAPDSPLNPFRDEASRWRNYVLVLLLLFSGLRRGEALNLKPSSVHDSVDRATGERVVWLDILASDGEDDTRYERPGIKTFLSNRQIPLDEGAATVFHPLHRRTPRAPTARLPARVQQERAHVAAAGSLRVLDPVGLPVRGDPQGPA